MIAYDELFTSTNIRGLAFVNGVAYVEFHGGRRFAYSMSLEMFNEMRGAKSIGGYFSKMVKGKRPVFWDGYRCDNSPCKNDAAYRAGHAAMPAFYICAPCSKDPRFKDIVFTPVATAQ